LPAVSPSTNSGTTRDRQAMASGSFNQGGK
jgi:hypothetical protein